jgi:GDP-4-dehydro-6-deoxy-D-mannose reductase
VGDLNVTRDFLDVEDILKAYFHLLNHGIAGEVYNVCSSLERSIESVLNQLMLIENVKAEIGVISDRLRKMQQNRSKGCNEKIKNHTGWKPTIIFEATLKKILNDWENKLSCQSHAHL